MEASMTDHAETVETAPTDPGEASGAELVERVGQLETELRSARDALRTAERRGLIVRALAGTGAVDIDAVAVVVEASMEAGARLDAAGVRAAVEGVRRSRPALFSGSGVPRGGAMGARIERPAARTPLEDAAHQAARSGDRTSLLHYLRLRRAASA